MAGRTYIAKALVLKRTKLGESDIIASFLLADGSQLRAVAKGARKPSSAFSSRLEIFSLCDLLLAQGKSLDIVKEARLIDAYPHLKTNIDIFKAASPVVEFLDRASQIGLEVPHIFDLSVKTLSMFSLIEKDNESLKLTVAFLIKALAFMGFKPSFINCVLCGEEIESDNASHIAFSSLDGGVVCSHCLAHVQTIFYAASQIRWLQILLYASLEEVVSYSILDAFALDLLRIIADLIRAHMGFSLKSVNFLFSHPC